MTNAIKNILLLLIMVGCSFNRSHAQAPASDDCSNAERIVIANSGFGLGNFSSSQINITNATVQTGENFAPAIFVAGLDDKSVWLKFSLPTIRAVRVTLSQPGTAIAAGDVGFAVYKDNNCLPTNDSISTKLTPIVTWGNTYHPCVPAGEYLVQVSSNLNANGPITINVEISDQTGAAYDHPVDAYAFGVANVHARKIDFETECQSIEDASEVCTILNNYQEYHKSAWFTFTTPAYLDYLVISVSGTGSPRYFPSGAANIQKKFGYNLYSGNAVTTPIGSLTLIDGCDSMLTNGDRAATQQYGCGILQPNTTYSIQLFIHKDFNDMVRLGIITGGAAPAAGPLPINTLPATNAVGVLPSSGAGTTTTVFDNFGCNSRHSVNPCNPSKPAIGTVVGNATYNLSTFFSFSLNRTVAITFRPGMINCGPRPVIRLFKQTLTANYRLIATNSNGCSDTAFVALALNPKPVLGNDQNQRFCEGTNFDLTTTLITTGLITRWALNNIPVTNPAAVNTAGSYQLIAENSFGCTDTAIVTLTISPKPALGNDTTISSCNTIDLTAVYNTTGLTPIWTKNNLPVTNPSAVTAAGVYQLIAQTFFGCKDTAQVQFTINPKPNLGNDTIIAICQGTTTNLTTLFNLNGLTAAWFFNNSPVAAPVAATTGGIYRLVASNNFGCSDTVLVTLNANPKPALGNDVNTSICSDGSINLLSQFSTGSNSNIWTVGNIPVSDPSSVNIAGTYQLISTTSQGCADTVLVNLSVTTAPHLIINNPATVCIPQTTDLTSAAVTAGSSAGLIYTYWQDAAATISYGNAAAATEGTWHIKGTNTTGCFTILPVTVSSYPVHIIDAGNDKGICDSDSTTTLSVQVSNANAAVTYQWQPVDIGGIQSPSAASTIVKPGGTLQEYIITVTDGYGCNYLVSDTILVTKQPPVPAFAGNDTIAVTGLPHQLEATGGVNYLWEPAGLLNNAAIANPLATVHADSILFKVTVTDDKGCMGYDIVKVRTYNGITYYVPNAFSPNGDGRNDIFKPIPVGIVSTELFRVFNRYGVLMFETNRYMNGWDGNYKGIAQPVGNYVWVLKGKGSNGKIIEMKGNVVLIR